MEQQENWDNQLPLVEFTYNNSYQQSIVISPYESLYGRRYQSLLCWHQGEKYIALSPDLVQETTAQIKKIRDKIQTAQGRQKSYVNNRRKPLEFRKSEYVLLKASPTIGIGRTLRTKKLNPR
ncbi:uncharacterized protein [Arachis hypogaea]|uniref:uncharacterized protein n=1 Tax=Arachis hypogaea TaxID=3818 RepID=UPI003B2131EE